MRWHPYREEIQDWLTTKEHYFSLQETQGIKVNVKKWKDGYLYIDMHELSLVEFPCSLHEWLKRKTTTNSTMWPLELVVWDQAKLERLKVLDNKWTWAIEFWFSRVKEGYIVEFVVEYT
jgi:hypothetical protein